MRVRTAWRAFADVRQRQLSMERRVWGNRDISVKSIRNDIDVI